jgi:Fic/DOC family
MNQPLFNNLPKSVGQFALLEIFALRVPEPMVSSFIVQGHRKSAEKYGVLNENYPVRMMPEDTPIGHLRFALKHEAFDLGLIVAALEQIGAPALEGWVRSEPTSAFARRAWFLYEYFLGNELDLEPVRTGNYVPLLDSKRFYVTKGQNSSRQRVVNNLLGNAGYCPMMRRTERLELHIAKNLDQEIRHIAKDYDPSVLARAANFLITKETRSTFDLEREKPSENRMELFMRALRQTLQFDTSDPQSFVRLQNAIVDPRYAEQTWRSMQVFIGETLSHFEQRVHCVFPHHRDLPEFMPSWMQMCDRMMTSEMHPVVVSAVVAFGFVFLHPFEDGNGRIHRFLLHHVLAKMQFTPPDLIFPISASILRDRSSYDRTLEIFSKRIMPLISWVFSEDGDLVVRNETKNLYRFWDATPYAEYVFERIADTLEHDFVGELKYLVRYDQALEAMRNVVDMPDRKVSLFIRLCLQNQGKLSRNKRNDFSELSDTELAQLERIVQTILGAG